MKEGLLEQIQSRAYWRINFQPLVLKTKLATMQDCSHMVEQNVVLIRGWDYPAFHRGGSPEHGGIDPCGDYFEGWVSWENHHEFWRMYKSGQFLHYLAMRIEWLKTDPYTGPWSARTTPGAQVAVLDTIYSLTEIFEFLARLSRSGLYDEGVRVSVSAHLLKGRELYVDDPRRISFAIPPKTQAERFEWKKEFAKDTVTTKSQELALEVLLAFFDTFGWNPAAEQIARDQKTFLGGRL